MRETKKQILADVEKGVKKANFVANNTLRVEYVDGDLAYRLHHTDVVTYKANGSGIVLNSGGWRTPTTKARLNEFSPFKVFQRRGVWFVETSEGEFVFYDGMLFIGDKLVTEEKQIDWKVRRKMEKMINKYVALVDKVETLPYPSNGDCWYCLLKNQEGKPLGDVVSDNDHLVSHMKEGYLFGAILVNSMREWGYSDKQIAIHYSLNLKYGFKRALRRYLKRRLL